MYILMVHTVTHLDSKTVVLLSPEIFVFHVCLQNSMQYLMKKMQFLGFLFHHVVQKH